MELYTFVGKNLYRIVDNKIVDPLSSTPTAVPTLVTTPSESFVSGEIQGNLSILDGFLESKGFITGSTGWRISADGSVEFASGTFRGDITGASGTFTGTITATTGNIGGFDIGSDYIRDTANTMGMASTVTGGDDVRFWAGDTYANRATADFFVTESGAVTASNFTFTGGNVGSAVIVALGALNIAARGWTQTCLFSPSSATIVSWSSGTFTSADGTIYSINANNTGIISTTVYIYLDVLVSTTEYQTTTLSASAIGAGKVLIGKAQNNTNEATFQIFGGIGGINLDGSNISSLSISANELAESSITTTKIVNNAIDSTKLGTGSVVTGKIAAGTIVAADIAAGAITGAKIDAFTITAQNINTGTITANEIASNTITGNKLVAGTITANEIAANTITANEILANSITANELSTALVYAGSIQIDTSGNIRSGQTAYATGTGWFIGNSGGSSKLSIGNTTNYFTWDGTYIKMKGSFDVGTGGLINNASYTVATLPVSPTTVGFLVPSAYE